MASFIKINGNPYPCPRRGLNLMVATIVDAARNANAVTVGQVVGREQQKINNLEWAYLTAEQWSAILKEFKNFYVTVSYPDMVNNTWTERKMYPGDRTAEPFHLDPVTQLPLDYIHCKVNLIEDKDMSISIGDAVIGRSYDRYNRSRGVRVNKGAFSNAY